jgi:alpha/beta superfamily hydrolase
MQLLMRRPEIDGFVAIAPPASSHDFGFLSPCPAPGLIVQGTEDDIAKEGDTYALYEKLSKQRNAEIEYAAVDGADHFFTKHMDNLIGSIDKFIKPRINRPTQPKKIRRDRKRKIMES